MFTRRKVKRRAFLRSFQPRLERLEPRLLLTAISLDRRLVGEIEQPGETDTFTFEIMANRRVSVSVDTSPGGGNALGGALVALRDPGGQVVAQADVPDGDPALRDVALSAPATYTIEVSAAGGVTESIGFYELHLADRDPTPRPIDFGQSISGALDIRDRVQLFDLEIGQDQLGTPFTIVVDGDQTVRPVLELFSPDGSLLVGGASGTNVFDTRIADFTALATDEGGAGTGTYQIRTTALTNALGYFDLGVSDRPVEPPREINFSTFVAGHLDHLADEDVYTFAALAGDVVTVSVAGTGFTPDLLLTGPDGFASGTGNTDTHLRTTLPADGTYEILVGGSGPASVGHGPYLLGLSHPRPGAQPIAFGERAAGEIAVTGDFVDYRLTVDQAQVGRPVSITVSDVTHRSSNSFRGRLELYAPDGTRLERIDDIHYSHGGKIANAVLPEAGTYTIRFRERTDRFTGNFTIGVSNQPLTDPTPIADFNTEVTAQIAPLGDVDRFTFDGAGGQIVTVDLLSGSNLDLSLYGPDGQMLAGSGDFDTLLDKIELPTDGTYTIEISAGGGERHGQLLSTGAYSFAVWTPDRAPAPIPITFGEVQPGRIDIRGDIVDFELEVGAEQVSRPVSIVVSDVTNRSSDFFRGRLELYAPDGMRLERIDDIHYSHGGKIADVVLAEAGTYTIRFRERTDRFTGSFSVAVSDQAVTDPTPLPAFNTAITGAIARLAEVDRYTFDGAGGQVLTVDLLSGSNLNLTLYGPQGQVVAGAGDFDTLLDLVTLPEEGQYTLAVRAGGGERHGQLLSTAGYSFATSTRNTHTTK